MDTSFRSRSGDHGTMVVSASVAPGNIVPSATTEYLLPIQRRKLWVRGASYMTTTVPVGAGTITATLKKRRASDGTDVTISNALNLEGVSADVNTAFTIPSSTPEASRLLQPGDLLFVEIACSSTMTTQHVNAHVVADLCVKE